MTPEQKAKAYAERTYMYGIQRAIAKAAHLAGQQAAWEWIPVTPETMPEERLRLQIHTTSGEIFEAAFIRKLFWVGALIYKIYEVTHFRYIPQDKPGEK